MTDEAADNGFETDITSMVDGLDVVADKLSRIARIFADIGEVIAEMGHLEIPTIASGQVIPYRTQISNASVGSGGFLDNHVFEDALYNAFTRAMASPDNEQTIDITLQVDGRTMANIVSKYQRQQSRAMGV